MEFSYLASSFSSLQLAFMSTVNNHALKNNFHASIENTMGTSSTLHQFWHLTCYHRCHGILCMYTYSFFCSAFYHFFSFAVAFLYCFFPAAVVFPTANGFASFRLFFFRRSPDLDSTNSIVA